MMMLSPAFMKVKTEASERKDTEGKHRGGESEESKGRKKQRSKDGKAQELQTQRNQLSSNSPPAKTGKGISWAFSLRIGPLGTRKFECAQGFTSRATVLTTAQEKRAM